MATYTVLTRTICEQAYLTKNNSSNPTILQGVPIETIIQAVADDVIPSTFPVWEGGSQSLIKGAILLHYWMREIGLETVGLWQYYVGTRLKEVMPWYVDLHQRLDAMGNIFDNGTLSREESFNHTEDITKSGTDTTTTSGTEGDTGTVKNQGTDTTNVSDKNTETGTVGNVGSNTQNTQNLFSDTPQNGLSDVEEGRYLTNATIDNNSSNSDTTETRNLENSRTGSSTLERDNTETRNLSKTSSGNSSMEYGSKDNHVVADFRTMKQFGFSGDKVAMLRQYNEMHLSIMQQIVMSVADCFMGVIG